MKKIRLLLLFIPLFLLTACSSDRTAKNEIKKEFGSFLYGNVELTDYNAYDYFGLCDSSINFNDIDKENRLAKIVKGADYSIESVDITGDTAVATFNVSFPEINEMISDVNFYTDMLLEYNDYISKTGETDREIIGMYMVDACIEDYIEDMANQQERKIKIPAVYSIETKKWEIVYEKDFFTEIFGEITNTIDMNDIIETKENIEADYDYKKIKELPSSNKSTRSSVKDPISIGEEASFDNTDYFYKAENYFITLKVANVIEGSKALDMVMAADSVNERILENGTEYVIAEVEITLDENKTESETVLFDTGDFSLMDSRGHFYANKIVFGLEEFLPVKQGETTKGYICFIADENVDKYLLFKDYMDNTLCFYIG